MMKLQNSNKVMRTFIVTGLLFLFLNGCGAGMAARQGEEIVPATKPMSEYVRSDIVYPVDAYDPWEGFNRSMYVLNYHIDKYVFLPIVGAYAWIMPDYLEDRISGIFKNLGELKNLTNSLLQFKGKAAATTTGRIVANSTIGLVGMYDPASMWGLIRQNEDFGQTLGHYGIGAGPYLVLPVLGPSTLRDTTGFVGDTVVRSLFLDWLLDDVDNKSNVRTAIDVVDAIDTRHRTAFRYYQSGSPFEYDLIRMLYLEKRKLDIAR